MHERKISEEIEDGGIDLVITSPAVEVSNSIQQ
jgi:hypothetical protein